jgi:hypothetical protein
MNRGLTILCLLAVTGSVSVPLAAQAADAVPSDKRALLDKAFGSTIVSTYPDGRQAELWLKADGSYTAEGRRHDPSKGHWDVKNDKLCLHPSNIPFSWCTGVPPGGMSRPWSAKAATGEPITIKLVKGMHGRDAAPRKTSDNQDAANANG